MNILIISELYEKLDDKFFVIDYSSTKRAEYTLVEIDESLNSKSLIEGRVFIGEYDLIERSGESLLLLKKFQILDEDTPANVVIASVEIIKEDRLQFNGKEYDCSFKNKTSFRTGPVVILGKIKCSKCPGRKKYSPYIEIESIFKEKIQDES